MNELDIIGLKLKVAAPDADLIKLIRSYTKESIAVIKKHLSDGDYIIQCEYESHKGLKQVIDLYNNLTAMGYMPNIYEEGDASDIEFLSNLSESYDEEDDDLFDDDF